MHCVLNDLSLDFTFLCLGGILDILQSFKAEEWGSEDLDSLVVKDIDSLFD